MDEAEVMRHRRAMSENRSSLAREEDSAERDPLHSVRETPDDVPVPSLPYDAVDDCGAASFPASDPPSWWSGR
jgi:hypothetical protein